MKHLFTLKTIMLACLLFVGMGAWAEDATMAAGTNGSAAKVGEKDAIKVGTSKAGGDMTITVPAGATSLEFYAAAWSGVTGLSLNITPAANVSPTSVSLTADAGIANNSPFTLSGTESSYKFTIALSNITAETTLTLTSSEAKRFVVWGATYTIGGGDPDPTPTLYTVTLGDNSEELTQTTAGGNVTLPTREGNSTYTFAGWSTTNNAEETTTAPTIIAAGNYKPTANITLYPVYKRVEGEEGYILSEISGSTTYYMKHDCSATTTKSEAEAFEWNTSTGLLTYTSGSSTYYITHQTSGSTSLVNNTTVPASGKEWTITDNTTNKTVKFNSKAQTTRYLGYSSGFKAYAATHTLNYELAGTTYYISTLPAEKPTPSLSFANPTYNATMGDAFVAPTLTNPQGVTVSYSSSAEGVATVNVTTGAISLVGAGTTTITATFAGNEDYKNASASYQLVVMTAPLTTMDEIFAAATTAGSTATDCRVAFNNWVVSGVKNNNAYVTDNVGKGFIIYQSNHGFVVGDILSGTAACNVQLYNGSSELTSLTSSSEGLTVTKGGVVTPVTTISLANLSGVNTGAVVSYENLQYDGTNFTDGETNLKPYNALITLPTLVNGKNYNVTGVYVHYVKNDVTTKEIAPRTEEDFELNEVINKYTVTFDVTENGTITVKDGETVINEGDEVAEGTTLTIECTPANADYRFKNWQYKEEGGTWNSRQTNPQNYTMPSANVQFRANFELIPTYTVAWSVNGVEVKSEDLKEGAAVVAPEVEPINGKVFYGWATSTIDGTTNVAPGLVTPAATATAAVTYYAVFANADVKPETWNEITTVPEEGTYAIYANLHFLKASISNSRFENAACDGQEIVDGKLKIAPASNCVWEISKPDTYYRFKNGTKYAGGTGSKNQGALLEDASADLAKWEISYTNNQFEIVNYGRSKASSDSGNKYLRNNGASGWATYASGTGDAPRLFKKEGGTTYSDYCTTVPAPVANTIDFYAAGEDAYYTTFSNDKAVTIPDMIEVDDEVAQFYVYTVWADGNELVFVDLDENDGLYYLSENEGYLIKAEFTGDVAYTGEKAFSVEYTELGYDLNSNDDDNALRPASEAKTGDNKYYMLAYSDNSCTPASLGFYWGAAEGAAFESRANSAYLALPKTTQVKGFRFNGNTTGIKTLNNEQFANKAVKRIVNGQLVIEKAGKMFNAAGAEMK